MLKNEIIGEINALKSLLADTDYKAIKYAEGQIPETEYAEIKEKRAAWRLRINEIEELLNEMGEDDAETVY